MTKAMTQTFPLAINFHTEGGLATYIRAVNTLPTLSAEEEQELALSYREKGDLDAARQLVLSQLRTVVRVARGFSGYGLPQADLIQEGNIGLMKAVKNFDPMRRVRLVSFAMHWIRAEIYDFVLKNWRIVKVATTKAQRKLFFNLRKSRSHLGWMSQNEVEDLADNLDVSEKQVLEMESRLSGSDVPFDASDSGDDEDFFVAPAGYLQDMRYNPETLASQSDQENERSEQIADALATLDDRSRDIIQRRWLDDENKPTLHELAEEYNISAERIRQIEKKALAVMKNSLAA